MPAIRPSREEDLAAITRVYAHHVLNGTGTFEIIPPSERDIAARRSEVLRKGLPWLVAEADGEVVGFAYCNWLRPREAFRFAAEDSIYLAPQSQGKGLGRALLNELCIQAELAGMRKMVAVIGDSGNGNSIGLHAALGFHHSGIVRSCGWKFERWLDIVFMEKALGAGDRTPPA